jgi:hypothetical protein
MTDEKRLNEIILRAIDLGLLDLGEGTRHTIYYHVERVQHLKREEIPGKLEEFHEALRKLLGEGTRAVEKLIIRNLYDIIGCELMENNSWTLVDYVRDVSQRKDMAEFAACSQSET